MFNYTISEVSEDSFLVAWTPPKNEISTPQLAVLIANLTNALLCERKAEIVNVTPAYQTLLVQYDLLKASSELLIQFIDDWLMASPTASTSLKQNEEGHLHQIPVYYGAETGVDFQALCELKSVSPAELIEQHTTQLYRVYAVGFQPGFAYLGFVDESLEVERHGSFKVKVPAGSVGIADRQTAIYPSESPGGWQIIGRTSVDMLPNGQSLLQVGDQVRFFAIGRQRYLELGGELKSERHK